MHLYLAFHPSLLCSKHICDDKPSFLCSRSWLLHLSLHIFLVSLSRVCFLKKFHPSSLQDLLFLWRLLFCSSPEYQGSSEPRSSLLSALAASSLGEGIADEILFMLRRLGTGYIKFLGRNNEICNTTGMAALCRNRKCIGKMESLESFTASIMQISEVCILDCC